jgi:hypothetical protein
MNTLVDTAKSASFRGGNIVIIFVSGVEIRFPIERNPRLAKGSPKQLGNIEISPYGLHWPELDEDLSFRGIMAGRFGQVQKSET